MIWDKLSGNEKWLVAAIIALALGTIFKRLASKDILKIWSPNTMMFTAALYYGIVGPFISLYNDDFLLRLVNHRPHYEMAWQGLLLFMVVYLMGYRLSQYKGEMPSLFKDANLKIDKLKKQGIYLIALGVFTVFLLKGFGLFSAVTFWETNQDIETIYGGGSFRGYLLNGMNFLIAATPLVVYMWRKKHLSAPVAFGLLFLFFAIFSAEGFRWRLVIAGYSGLAMYYISRGQKIKVLPVVLVGLAFIAYMGILEISRTYGRGLDLTRSQQKSFAENVLLGFNEAAVFQATGYVMSKTGENFDYIGLRPITESLVTPIPRAIWPGKPTGSYISNITKAYSFNGRNLGLGQAVLNYGEYYMAYGWWGIVFYGLGLGVLMGWLEKLALRRIDNPWILAFYLLNAGYAYVIFSRGYMPQQFMFYFFTVFPALFLARKYRKVREKPVLDWSHS